MQLRHDFHEGVLKVLLPSVVATRIVAMDIMRKLDISSNAKK